MLLHPTNLMVIYQTQYNNGYLYNTDFDDITIPFTNQNDRPLEMGDKVILLIKKQR